MNLFFLLFGAAVFLYSRFPRNRGARRAAACWALVGAALSVVLMILSGLSIHPDIEHPGMAISGEAGGSPIGHMPPLTALCFFLAGASLLLLIISSPGRKGPVLAAFVLAAIIELISMTLSGAYLLGGPLLYGSGVIPPALSASLAFLALGTALLLLSGSRAWPRDLLFEEAGARSMLALMLIFVFFSAGIFAAGYLYFRGYEQSFRIKMEHELASAADWKVSELTQWRRERLGDSSMFFHNYRFSGLVKRVLDDPGDAEAKKALRMWLGNVRTSYGYDRVFLLDVRGRALLSVPDVEGSSAAHFALEVPRVLHERKIFFNDFHRDSEGGPVYLAVMTPVFEESEGKDPLGVMVMRIDPETYLYPLIRRWPTPSRTAETLLVRREGEDVLFLNDLRFHKNAALNLRIPLKQMELPAVMAVGGGEGMVEGVDYRGVQVLAALRAVPDSPWFLVARIDSSEVYAPARERLWIVVGLVAVLLLAAGGGAQLLLRGQKARFYQERCLVVEERMKSEERYRVTLMSVGDGVIGADAGGRVELMNPVAESLTGRSESEARGRPLDEVFHIISEKTGEPVENPVSRVLAEGSVVGLANHTLLIAKDGSERPIAYSGAPIRGPGGALSGVVLVFRDQTEERAAQRALQESEEKYRRHFINASDTIYSIDRTGVILDISPGVERSLGYKPEDLVGKRFIDLKVLTDESLRKAIEDTIRIFRGETIESAEYEFIARDGTHRFGEVSGSPILVNGKVAAVVSVARDVTARRNAEAALRRSMERDHQTLDNMMEGCQIIGFDWRYLYVNAAAAEHGRKSAEELVGRTMMEAYPGMEDTEMFAAVKSCMESRKAEGMDNEFTYPDGSKGWLELSIQPVAEGVFILSMDITERRRAEEEREKLQAQLLQSQRLEAVGRLVGGVAHDFNNMLSVIGVYSEMALKSLDPQSRLYADILEIQQAGARSADLTRQLLAFAGSQTIAPEVMDLNDTVGHMLKMVGRLIGEDIDLLWKPAGNLWLIKMDPVQVDRILANLAVNARDAIEGVGKITIETHNVEFDETYCRTHADFIPGQFVMLAVSDDGSGMDEETRARIFEPFYTTKPMGQGTGLGLATVYGIVKQNNGFINVYSEPGRGTTFRIYLPRGEAGMEAHERPEKIEAPTGTETVLLVEDEAALLKIGQRLLKRLGYNVLAANGPTKAINIAGEYEGDIHLLLTDVVMPEMNGRDLWERLREIRPDLKCLFMSGYTANVIAHRGVLDEGVNFLQKPFSEETLATKVREALED